MIMRGPRTRSIAEAPGELSPNRLAIEPFRTSLVQLPGYAKPVRT